MKPPQCNHKRLAGELGIETLKRFTFGCFREHAAQASDVTCLRCVLVIVQQKRLPRVAVLALFLGSWLFGLPARANEWRGPAAVSPDGVWIAASEVHLLILGESITFWSLAENKEVAAWPINDKGVVSPDRKTLVLHGGKVRLFDLVKGTEMEIPSLQGAAAVAYAPDGARLIVELSDRLSEQAEFVLLDTTSGKEVSRHKLKGKNPALSADGKTLAIVAGNHAGRRQIELWNTATWQREHAWAETRGTVSHLLFSPDGRWLAIGVRAHRGPQTLVALREIATGRERAVAAFPILTDHGLHGVTFAAA
jgi:hypothetical protein